jgi:hypothetical protein
MTLQDLLENLKTLHPSASTATITIRNDALDLDIIGVRYDDGEVIIDTEEFDD